MYALESYNQKGQPTFDCNTVCYCLGKEHLFFVET